MSANRRRGEVEIVLDGRPRLLCLTLGALAELESAYAAQDLGGLVERFSSGRLSATDLVRILGAGLRGAGTPIDDGDVAKLHPDGGMAALAQAIADLLALTFGSGDGSSPDPRQPQRAGPADFPGTR